MYVKDGKEAQNIFFSKDALATLVCSPFSLSI